MNIVCQFEAASQGCLAGSAALIAGLVRHFTEVSAEQGLLLVLAHSHPVVQVALPHKTRLVLPQCFRKLLEALENFEVLSDGDLE